MTTILGIDAAWTATQPSGVAVVSSTACNWRLIFAGSSYRHLLAQAEEDLISTSRPSGSVAEAAALLAAAGKIAGAPVDLVAVDMPPAARAKCMECWSELLQATTMSSHVWALVAPPAKDVEADLGSAVVA